MSESLADRILRGDIRAAGRLMRHVDDQIAGAHDQLDALFEHTGAAHIIGVTGHPGSGKSTLVNALISLCRRRDLTVGVVAVDPTSPFSGGAILGDRIRMQEHSLDKGVFIRSVATRGNLGGLSRSTPAMVQILEAMGFEVVIIETVGVGQDEVDVVGLADTNVVVAVPGMGDDVQATKAGILEIADLFAINKSDHAGADRLRRELKTMLSLADDQSDGAWTPPVIHTVATQDDGIDTLLDAAHGHRRWLEGRSTSVERDRRRIDRLLRLIVAGQMRTRLQSAVTTRAWQDELDTLVDRRTTPYRAADRLMARLAETKSTEK